MHCSQQNTVKTLQGVNYNANLVTKKVEKLREEIFTRKMGKHSQGGPKTRTPHVPEPFLGCCQALGTVSSL